MSCHNVKKCGATDIENASMPQKPRLIICGHTYSIALNRAKALALSEWFNVMVCAPDYEGVVIFGRDGSTFDNDDTSQPYLFRRHRRWPRSMGLVRFFLMGFNHTIKSWAPHFILCEAEPWSFLRWQSWFLGRIQRQRPLLIEFTWENIRRPGLKGLILDRIYKMAALTTSAVIAGNQGARNLFLRAGLANSRILVTGQLGIDPVQHSKFTSDQKRQWRTSRGFTENSFVIGFCGRLIPEKGVLDLIAAVRLLKADVSCVELALLGSGPQETEIRSAIAGEDWCRILPSVAFDCVAYEIGCFDMLVLPSKPQHNPKIGDVWEEQFGHVLIEAMACGVPTFGSSSGAIPEVLERSDIIFPSGDVPALRNMLLTWIRDKDRLEALGADQRDRTLNKWSHRSLAERYKTFLLNHDEFRNQNFIRDD